MTKKDLAKLRNSMPNGYRDYLAAKFRVSTPTVDRTFRGEGDRHDIIEAAIVMAEDHKRMLDEQASRIKSL